MKATPADHLRRAHGLLGEAETMLSVALNAAAARTAYLAAFHAAQALILQRGGRPPKTHRGVQSEFFRLTRDDETLAPDVRRFLSRGYELKSSADYSLDKDMPISASMARNAIEQARAFIGWVETTVVR